MIDTILAFTERLLPHLRREGVVFFPDDTHRVTLLEMNGNPVFVHESFVAGQWYSMGSIQVGLGPSFWTRVVEVLRLYFDAKFSLPDETVASAGVMGLPGADRLTQEEAREKVIPPTRRRAGAENPGFTGTIKSRLKTKTRDKQGGPHNEVDVIDQLTE